jgi:hypothetical protein
MEKQMKRKYAVFSVHHQPAMVEASLADGTKVSASVDSLDVQLVPEAGSTIKLSIVGSGAIAEAEALFGDGAMIDVEFTGAQ